MIIDIYTVVDDFHRELAETYVAEYVYINHFEKYMNISIFNSVVTIKFDEIYCHNADGHYEVCKSKDLSIPKLDGKHACDSCKNKICEDRDIVYPIPKSCKGYIGDE